MPDQDPYAATAEKEADPYAASAEGAVPAPTDFTANPKGEGLYRMLPASNAGFTKTSDEIQVPFSRVGDAQGAGYHLHFDEAPRYEKDSAHQGEGPTLRERAGARIEKLLQPSEGKTGQAPTPIPGVNINAAKAAGRVLYGTPEYLGNVLSAAVRSRESGNVNELLDLIDPGSMPKGLYDQFKADWAKDHNLAIDNLKGSLIGMGVVGAATHGAAQAVEAIPRLQPVRTAVRSAAEALTNTGPRELKKMAERYVKTNAEEAAKAEEQNQVAAGKHRDKTQDAVHETAGREMGHKAHLEAEDAEAREQHAAKMAKVQKENAAALKAHQDAVKATQEANAQKLQEHIAAVEESSRSNQAGRSIIDARQGLEKQIADDSAELKRRHAEAETNAKKENDAAWAEWRTKVAGAETPSDPAVNAIKQARSVMDLEDVAEFRRVLQESKPEIAEMGEAEKLQNEIMAGQFPGKTWEQLSEPERTHVRRVMESSGFDADEIEQSNKPIGAERLHVWKTQLEYAERRATRGNVRFGISIVLDAVRAMEDTLTEEAGGSAELKKARALHGPYKDTFVNSPNEPPTVASKAYQETTPEIARTEAEQRRLDMLGNYDTQIPKLSKQIANARERLSALPSETAARGMLKTAPLPPEVAPLPTAPELAQLPPAPAPATERIAPPERAEHPDRPPEVVPEQETINPRNVYEDRVAATAKAAEQLRSLGVRRAINALFYTTPSAVLSTLLGHPGYAITEVLSAPIILTGSHALAGLMENHTFVNWIGKITPRDAAMWERLPAAEKAVFTENLRQAVDLAKKRGVPVSPAATAFIVASGAGKSAAPKTAGQIRGEGEKRKQQAAPSAVPGPQSAARPYTHFFDQERGTIVPA